MKRIIISLLFLMGILAVKAQTTDVDTTIYQVVEEMPRFPGCEGLDTTMQVKLQCAQQSLLNFVYQNVIYPVEARENGHEGTVVVTFVVEKDGTISNPKVVRDVEGGCGAEAVRVVNLMNEVGAKWVPAKHQGKAVRLHFNLPVKFKLEEPLPYVLIENDTVYSHVDSTLRFVGGIEALQTQINDKLSYPEIGNDSCLIGSIDVRILVRPNNDVKILDITDYNDLGFDFWYESISASTSTMGKWYPAEYEGRKVTSAYDLNMTFIPTDKNCENRIEKYSLAGKLANEGAKLFNNNEQEAGIAKMTEAIELFPNDANLLYVRGQAYLEMNLFEEACIDLSKVKRIALIRSFDTILPLICK